ncbi:hypothetical protein Hanom_Chr13g01185261 [Helianthus anomalus]
MAHRRYPSFFKILLQPSAPHLPLPPNFVRNQLKNKTPKYLIIHCSGGGCYGGGVDGGAVVMVVTVEV